MAVAVPDVDELAATLSGAPFVELSDALGQLESLRNVVRSVQLRFLRKISESDEWVPECGGDFCDWVSMRCGLSRAESKELVEVAEALGTLPSMSRAFDEGRLPWRHLCLMVEFADSETDAHLANDPYSLRELKLLARKRRVRNEDSTDAFQRRGFCWARGETETRFRGSLPNDMSAVVIKSLSLVASRVEADPDSGLRPTVEQSQADALVELASMELSEEKDADRATVVIEVDTKTLVSDEGAGLVDDYLAPPEVIRRLACDGRIQVATVDEQANTIGVGRVTRSIPPWLVRRLRKRDGGCRFPECHRKRWVHGHHIRHWCHDGPTDMGNLTLLCALHHRFVHDHGWAVRGDPSETLEFIRPDGRVYESSPPALGQNVRERFQEMLFAG